LLLLMVNGINTYSKRAGILQFSLIQVSDITKQLSISADHPFLLSVNT
jgi:hypothetical protein